VNRRNTGMEKHRKNARAFGNDVYIVHKMELLWVVAVLFSVNEEMISRREK